MRAFIWTAISIALSAVLVVARPSHAGGLAVATAADGSLSVKDGDKMVASLIPKTRKTERGPATVREVTVSGHAVIEIRIPLLGEGARREEVWIAERTAAPAKVIWWNVAGARDPDGETFLVVKLTNQAIEEYQTAARLSRCDGSEVALFKRKWDFATRNFRATDLELPARAASAVTARRGDAPTGKPLGGFSFAAASSSSGVAGDAGRLKPPAAVGDRNPDTVWSTDGGGRGHVLTARSSGGFPITGLRLLPGDTSSEKSYRSSAKPRRLILIFSRDPSQSIEVDLAEDADGGNRRFRQPFWIALPKPVASSCVTVLVRETTSDKTPLSIADLDVLTELDGPEAADRLVTSLAQGIACQARQPLLVRLGDPALAKVSAAIAKAAPSPGRECLVDTLAALVAAGAAPKSDTAAALVAALDHSSEGEEKTILKLLPTMAPAPIGAIAAVLHDGKRSDDDRVRAARVLAAMDKGEARTELLTAVGQGSRPLRKALRLLVANSKAPALAAVLAQHQATPPAQSARRADFLPIIGALAGKEPDARPAALAVLRAPLDGAGPFEEQARAIAGLGLVRDPAAIAVLADVRSQSGDGVLRSLAVTELVHAEGPAVVPALRAALQDTDPQVRETAAAELGHKRDKGSVDLLIAGAKQEPWPLVRRAEIVALGELCTTAGNQLLIRAFERDIAEVRQAALVGIARCYRGKAAGTLLHTLGRLAESADMRSLAARLLGERRDPRTASPLAEILTRLVTESQADLSLEAVIADTSMALAAIRTPEAVSALVALLSDPRASVQRIAIDALAVVCDPGPGAAALRAAAKNQDEAVSLRAAAAEARCRERR